MTPLRQKMINDMKLRRFSSSTQQLYIHAVEGLAKYYSRSPDSISEEEVMKTRKRNPFFHKTLEKK